MGGRVCKTQETLFTAVLSPDASRLPRLLVLLVLDPESLSVESIVFQEQCQPLAQETCMNTSPDAEGHTPHVLIDHNVDRRQSPRPWSTEEGNNLRESWGDAGVVSDKTRRKHKAQEEQQSSTLA